MDTNPEKLRVPRIFVYGIISPSKLDSYESFPPIIVQVMIPKDPFSKEPLEPLDSMNPKNTECPETMVIEFDNHDIDEYISEYDGVGRG